VDHQAKMGEYNVAQVAATTGICPIYRRYHYGFCVWQ